MNWKIRKSRPDALNGAQYAQMLSFAIPIGTSENMTTLDGARFDRNRGDRERRRGERHAPQSRPQQEPSADRFVETDEHGKRPQAARQYRKKKVRAGAWAGLLRGRARDHEEW